MVLALLEKCRENKPADRICSTRRLALIVEYDGGRYAGSQRQKNKPSVQGALELGLQGLTGEQLSISLAGRTDAGVHARGQVISFITGSALPLRAFVLGLNHHLPSDIAIKSAWAVTGDFDPRRSASRREYDYYILTSEARAPLWEGRAYHRPGRLNIDLMNEAGALLEGVHDFASFVTGVIEHRSTIRDVEEVHVCLEVDVVIIRMIANAFLPHQVRNTVGALVQVGLGRITIAEFENIIAARQPSLAGPTAPACGLYLNKVYYDKSFEERIDENL
jgi:tRNA pseudouridine38-40 synthase